MLACSHPVTQRAHRRLEGQVVPIWKKEIWEEGGGAWVAGHTVDVAERIESGSTG